MSSAISRLSNWVNDKNNAIPITSSLMDAEFNQLVSALNRKVIASASAPVSPTNGDTWVDTTNGVIKFYNGSSWIELGRAVKLTNGSGSQRVAGDVVVVKTTADSTFTTTTAAGDNGILGVVLETIADASAGYVQVSGLATVTVDGSTTRGQYLKTSTTAAKATPTSAATDAGIFGVALTASVTSVTAMLTGVSRGGGRSPTGAFKNLSVTRGSATQVTVTADELILDDGTRITSVNETAAITASGADGLDTGSEASNTWYYIYIIRKSSDGTVASLLSTSSSSPTMPSGYDQKALVSAVRNDGSSNFVNFIQTGSKYIYPTGQTAYNGTPGAGWTAVDITAYVPSALSNYCFGTLQGSTSNMQYMTNDNTVSSTLAAAASNRIVPVAAASVNASYNWQYSVLTANTLYVGISGSGIVYIDGFEINKLV